MINYLKPFKTFTRERYGEVLTTYVIEIYQGKDSVKVVKKVFVDSFLETVEPFNINKKVEIESYCVWVVSNGYKLDK